MKKIILIATLIIIFVITIILYIYSKKKDTMYAIEYAQVFGSYDIEKVDQYLSEETLITYNSVSHTYKELRANVIAAFEKQAYEMPIGSGNDRFIKGVQTIGIQAYVNSKEYSSEFISMEIEHQWLVFYTVKSITSSDDFFCYLFFGKK